MVKPVILKVPTAIPRAHGYRLRAHAGADRLVLITDMDRIPDPFSAVSALPPGSVVILRDYHHPRRAALAHALRRVCRQAGCWFLVAGDIRFARKVRADGLHVPEYQLFSKGFNRAGFRFVSAACHSRKALAAAVSRGIDLALVSPLFETASHPGQKPLGVHRFSRMTANLPIAIAALGGINFETAGALRGLKLSGVAGISGIAF